jgi:lipoprotein-anchoring transpeptidase ErfK/SrfK
VLARRHLPPLLVASLLLPALALTGVAQAADGPATTPTGPTVRSDAAGAKGWKIGAPVRVRVTGGALTAVTLTGPDGRQVRGRLAPSEWTSKGKLVPRSRYVLQASAVAPDGQVATLRDTVRTGKPKRVLRASIRPDGYTVGVGRPVVVSFNRPVRRRADVEAALTVTTSREVGPASWSWTSPYTVQFRPKGFWPARTRVTVTADLRKVHAGPALWGMRDTRGAFRVGRSLVMRVSDAKHRMHVVRNGKRIRTFGVSMGKPGFTTRSGIKVIMDTHASYRMRSTTVGITGSEAYDLDVPYAMRMTSSGEFLHGAPWNDYIGTANRSHGCTNLTLSDARWVYNRVREGDPVITRGTGRSTEAYNGLGGVWNMPWKKWVAGSALS